jgi:hypothetical protein
MRRVRPRGDGGVTLVELIISVGLMATAFLTVAAGIDLYVQSSVTHRGMATVQVEMQKYIAAIRGVAYSSCVGNYTVAAASYSPPSTINPSNSVRLWNSATSTYSTVPSVCNVAGSQLVTVTLTYNDGDSRHDYSETMSFGRRS